VDRDPVAAGVRDSASQDRFPLHQGESATHAALSGTRGRTLRIAIRPESYGLSDHVFLRGEWAHCVADSLPKATDERKDRDNKSSTGHAGLH
jgi:hypothetical protein